MHLLQLQCSTEGRHSGPVTRDFEGWEQGPEQGDRRDLSLEQGEQILACCDLGMARDL